MRTFWMVILLTFGAAATAQETTTKIEDVKPAASSEEDDVDLLITNSMMRAESGSKSKWSLASSLNYSGGSVEKPLAEDRPNLTGEKGNTDKSLIEGQLSVKYLISKQHSVMAGVGLRWIAPLQSSAPKDWDGDRMDAQNPYLIYQYLSNWRGLQSMLQIQPIYYTNSNLTRKGFVSAVNIEQNSMYELGESGVSIGASVWGQIAFFNKSGELGKSTEPDYLEDVREEQSDYGFGFEPVVEYEINETLSLRSVTSLWNFEHIRSEPRFSSYEWNKVTQSIGLGISVTRDVFLYPNVQFFPDDIRADRTNVGIDTTINVF